MTATARLPRFGLALGLALAPGTASAGIPVEFANLPGCGEGDAQAGMPGFPAADR